MGGSDTAQKGSKMVQLKYLFTFKEDNKDYIDTPCNCTARG